RLCEKCAYNLRGLTLARCPECGQTFDPTSPAWDARTPGTSAWPGWIAGLVLLIVPLVIVTAPMSLVLVMPIIGILAVSAVQAAGEVLIAFMVMRELNWPRFRAW